MLLPPLVGAFTSQMETFSVALPGMWLMGASPLFLGDAQALPLEPGARGSARRAR